MFKNYLKATKEVFGNKLMALTITHLVKKKA